MASGQLLAKRGIDTRIPYTVDENGAFTTDAPGFEGKRVINDKGEKGDANEAVIKALIAAGNLVARGKPEAPISPFLALEKTDHLPQHAAMVHRDGQTDRGGNPFSPRSGEKVAGEGRPDEGRRDGEGLGAAQSADVSAAPHPGPLPASGERGLAGGGATLREIALGAIKDTRWVPASGENRINGMVGAKPDWVMSRQRAWGVPIAVFVAKGGHEILIDDEVNKRIADAFEAEGADAWFAEGAKARFLGNNHDPDDFDKIDDVLDVWFDSGSTHSYVLEDPVHFPGLAGIKRKVDGGADEVMYLEGSDQHRGWFQSSLARELRHARARAVRRRADAWLHARREGPENVEVARQPDLSAGHHQTVRRRHPAPLGRQRRLFRRSAHRAGSAEKRQRQLPQIAQHDPLDARHARALRARRGGRLRRDGRTRPADAASPRRTRRRDPRGLCRVRLCARDRGARRRS